MDQPIRKRLRLKNWNYNSRGVYFLTICSLERRAIFSRIVGRGILDAPLVELTEAGKLVEESIRHLNVHRRQCQIDAWVIMPNHVHLLVRVEGDGGGGASGKPRPTNAAIPALISSLKRYTNRASGRELWQDGCYDHIIRDEADYLVHLRYIEENPAKWAEDEYHI